MNLKKSNIIGIVMLIFLNSCAQKSPYKLLNSQIEKEFSPTILPHKIAYKILPNDRVAITLYKYPNITPTNIKDSNGILVDEIGNIHPPLIDKVQIAGLTQPEATRLLEEKYRKYLIEPSLYLEVLNKRCYVLGEVKKAGVVPLDREKLSLLEALAYAGDLTDNAVRDDIVILSHDAQNNMILRHIDLTNFDTLRFANLLIKPNDIIYVQPDDWKEYKITAENLSFPFTTISQILAPFITVDYLTR